MTEQTRKTARLAGTLAALALMVAGCTNGADSAKAPVEHRGTDPASGAAAAPADDGGGAVVTAGAERYVVAVEGDTVASLAARSGISAAALAVHNGLTAESALFAGQDLVVPPGAGLGGDTRVGGAISGGSVSSAPLSDGGVPVAADGTIAGDGVTDGTRTADAARGGWSPELAANAIARSNGGEETGATGLKEDGRLAAPPSSTEPVPDEPKSARNLESPDLDQYQTRASEGDAAAAPTETEVAATETAKTTATTGGSAGRLQRPVSGPIAIGFGQGSGPTKNDGVDFSAAAGAPVVAAADGEVALVSKTLGGLGTIVLVRHPGELLTVYGRIDDVGVKKGDIVRRGQKLGVVAAAEKAGETRMHFEVRRGATVLDPMGFL